MKFGSGDNVNSSVEDRRGLTPMHYGAGAGGLGVVGVIIYVVVRLLGGDVEIADPSGGASGGQASQDQATANGVAPTDTPTAGESCVGASSQADQAKFVACVETSVQKFWATKIDGYKDAKLVLYRDATPSGCGTASAEVGPFYCSADTKVYLDTGFFDELHKRFGAKGGDFAEAYVVAHEYGHHVQDILGTMDKIQSQERSRPSEANALSVKLELQADCYAGVWGHDAYANGKVDESEIAQALDAAASVGDDRIQKRVRGRVNRESFTHGSADERQKAFQLGMGSGDPNACKAILD
ncbi:MAG: neutral zinc metallopeptidase [Polyangiaceae bacterium]